MKVFLSILSGFLILIFRLEPLFAAPSSNIYNNELNYSGTATKTSRLSREEKAHIRSLRRQHTREAYDRNDTTPASFRDDDSHRYRKGKKMTADERMKLRQQIDEVGQTIYHQ